jgi:hypothetical protein
MSHRLEDFARRIVVRADNVPEEVNRIKRLCALAIDQTVVLATPVDTGRARSNWLVSLGDPRDDTIPPYAPIPHLIESSGSRIGEHENAQAAIEQGKGEIALARAGQDIHLTNNLPYIQFLNEGRSAQAPAMFVESAIQAGVAAVAGAKLDTGVGLGT